MRTGFTLAAVFLLITCVAGIAADPQAPGPAGRVTASIPLGFTPADIAVGHGSLWATSAPSPARTKLARIDPLRRTVIASVTLPEGGFSAIALTAGGVWVSLAKPGVTDDLNVIRIDPATNRVSARLTAGVTAGRPAAMAVGHGSVWVANAMERKLYRIDPLANVVTAAIGTGGGASSAAITAGAVWVANIPEGTLGRIDPRTNRRAGMLRPVGNGVLGAARGALWLASVNGGSAVQRIDAATGRVGGRVNGCPPAPPSRPQEVVGGGGSLWVAGVGGLCRIRSRTNTVVGVMGRTGELAFGHGTLWVAAGQLLLRVKPA